MKPYNLVTETLKLMLLTSATSLLLLMCSTPKSGRTDLTHSGFEAWQPETGEWTEGGDAQLKPADPGRLNVIPGKNTFINGDDGRTEHLISEAQQKNTRAHVEFLVAQNSNSGVYFQGRYEIQVFDSWNKEPDYPGNCAGGIYERWDETRDPKGFEGHNPAVNASYPPGVWQSFDVLFRAPDFNAEGNKIRNAEFVKVLHNGIPVHENVAMTGPTRASLFEDEQPSGPLMLQGDHGPVAYRNIWLTDDLSPENLEWKSLFDGKTLNGWDIRPGGKWEVKDGNIVGTSPKSEKRHGILLSQKRYSDFTLSLKYKAKKGNSGLYFRVETVDSEVTVNGFQAEIDESKDIGGLYETGGRAWVIQPTPDQVANYFKPQDWNTMIVSARGQNVLVFVNGHKTASLIDDPGRTEGFIGLQLHGSMEMDVAFKDIKIISF